MSLAYERNLRIMRRARARNFIKPRRWFSTPELLDWKQRVSCGDYAGPFFTFPNNPSGIDPWKQNAGMQNWVASHRVFGIELGYGLEHPFVGPYGFSIARPDMATTDHFTRRKTLFGFPYETAPDGALPVGEIKFGTYVVPLASEDSVLAIRRAHCLASDSICVNLHAPSLGQTWRPRTTFTRRKTLLGFPYETAPDGAPPVGEIKFGTYVVGVDPSAGDDHSVVSVVVDRLMDSWDPLRAERSFFTTSAKPVTCEDLTLQGLIDAMEKLGPPLPRLEFQVGNGQTWAFGQALARAAGMPIEHRLRSSYSYSEFGSIPIVEYDRFPAGCGWMVETDSTKLLWILYWRSGELTAYNCGSSK